MILKVISAQLYFSKKKRKKDDKKKTKGNEIEDLREALK